MNLEFSRLFGSVADGPFLAKYRASCHCGAVEYGVSADPLDAKICHCQVCQKLHGAPMQWSAIFEKHLVRILQGLAHVCFYNSESHVAERILPCKVSCRICGAHIADEGRNMWLAFPPLFDFGTPPVVPPAFRPTCHIFYGNRCLDLSDNLPKWEGHKEKSEQLA